MHEKIHFGLTTMISYCLAFALVLNEKCVQSIQIERIKFSAYEMTIPEEFRNAEELTLMRGKSDNDRRAYALSLLSLDKGLGATVIAALYLSSFPEDASNSVLIKYFISKRESEHLAVYCKNFAFVPGNLSVDEARIEHSLVHELMGGDSPKYDVLFSILSRSPGRDAREYLFSYAAAIYDGGDEGYNFTVRSMAINCLLEWERRFGGLLRSTDSKRISFDDRLELWIPRSDDFHVQRSSLHLHLRF